MIINILKSGKWAEKGIKVVYLEKGEQDVNQFLAAELIAAGRAVLAKPETISQPVKQTVKQPVEQSDNQSDSHPEIESVEKGKAGWWSVKFKNVEKVIKVKGADDDEEAKTLAIAKLEVQ